MTKCATAKSMRVCGSKSLYQFQKGPVILSQSLPKLYEMLKERYNISYILTYRLNQDGLEHLFAYLQQMGASYDQPTLVSFTYRVRTHLLGKKSVLVGSSYNSETDNSDIWMSEGSFSKLDIA